MDTTSVLPYRTDALALTRWLAARVRGRSAEQLRAAVDSPKAVEGTAAAASALGFTDSGEGGLTQLGERFALADAAEQRQLLREAMLGFVPYRDLLYAIGERGNPVETEVRWLEAWWATQGYGSSESNRREGAAAFGRLGDFAGIGEYVPGRRGRPTRIRWGATPFTRPRDGAGARQPTPPPADSTAPDLFTAAVHAPAPERSAAPRGTRSVAPAPVPRSDPSEVNRITVPLAGEATARIEVPLRLGRAEKRRLLDLLELLITED